MCAFVARRCARRRNGKQNKSKPGDTKIKRMGTVVGCECCVFVANTTPPPSAATREPDSGVCASLHQCRVATTSSQRTRTPCGEKHTAKKTENAHLVPVSKDTKTNAHVTSRHTTTRQTASPSPSLPPLMMTTNVWVAAWLGGWLAYRTSLRWSSAFSEDLAANSLRFSWILYWVFFTSLNADSCFLSSVAAYSYDGSCRVGCGWIELSCRPDWLMLLRLRFWTGWTLVARYFVAAYLNEMRCRMV